MRAGRLNADDAGTFIQHLNVRTGNQFAFVGMAELGETNAAAFVRWPDGRDGVLTRTSYPIEHLENTAGILDLVRSHGIPVPRYELIVEFDGWAVVIQERLPGAPLAGRHIDLPMMEAILALNESFTGLLVDRSDVPTINPGPGIPRNNALDNYDDRTRELLTRIREIHDTNDQPITGHDLVHGDFSLPNILFDAAGILTGIVDWHDHTLYRGDRRYSLVPLRFDLAWGIVRGWTTVDPEAMTRLDQALDTIEPATMRLYWTWPSLNLVGAMIEEERHTDIDYLVAIAWSRLL